MRSYYTSPILIEVTEFKTAYYDVSGYGTNNVTAHHAGFAIATSGNKYTAIEGNAVKLRLMVNRGLH